MIDTKLKNMNREDFFNKYPNLGKTFMDVNCKTEIAYGIRVTYKEKFRLANQERFTKSVDEFIIRKSSYTMHILVSNN